MGFSEERAKYALQTSGNNFEEAIEKLTMPGLIPDNPQPLPSAEVKKEKSNSQPEKWTKTEETKSSFI